MYILFQIYPLYAYYIHLPFILLHVVLQYMLIKVVNVIPVTVLRLTFGNFPYICTAKSSAQWSIVVNIKI